MQPHQRGALMPNLLQRWAPCGQRSLESNDGESDELSVITEVRRNRGKSGASPSGVHSPNSCMGSIEGG
eukprot:scaffold110207_cov20-Tisochrysis_lutea.AAC.2